MGLESKRGLPRYLQAREYRKAAKDTLKFVKVAPAHCLKQGFSYPRRRSQTELEMPRSDKARRWQCHVTMVILYLDRTKEG